MTQGVERRAQIDNEGFKALVLINGGGAVALLAFLPSIISNVTYQPLARFVLYALIGFQFGIASAVIHNFIRRRCSLVHEAARMRPKPCDFWLIRWLKRREPCVCILSKIFKWLSLFLFVLSGLLVAIGGFKVVGF